MATERSEVPSLLILADAVRLMSCFIARDEEQVLMAIVNLRDGSHVVDR